MLLVLNLFVGFVIDAFLEVYKSEEEMEEDMSKWKARLMPANQELGHVCDSLSLSLSCYYYLAFAFPSLPVFSCVSIAVHIISLH